MYIASNLHPLSPLVHHHRKAKFVIEGSKICVVILTETEESRQTLLRTHSPSCSCASPCGLDGIDEEDDDERRHPKKKMTERM
jgi:hypothetical protein